MASSESRCEKCSPMRSINATRNPGQQVPNLARRLILQLPFALAAALTLNPQIVFESRGEVRRRRIHKPCADPRESPSIISRRYLRPTKLPERNDEPREIVIWRKLICASLADRTNGKNVRTRWHLEERKRSIATGAFRVPQGTCSSSS